MLSSLVRRGLAPVVLARIGRRGTPVPATLLVATLILVLALLGDLGALARATSGIMSLVFVLVDTSLLVLTLRRPEQLSIHSLVPGFALASTLGLLFAARV